MTRPIAIIVALAGLGVVAGCVSDPEGACARYCTVTLDYCGPGSAADVKECTSACKAELEGQSAECGDAFAAYANCYYDDGDCDVPQCDDEFDTWAAVCYASGDLDGPFELTVEVDEEVVGSWDTADPSLLRCQYPITVGAAQGGIGLMTEVWWDSTTVETSQFCGAQGKYNAGITELLGSQLIKAGVPMTMEADLACEGAFVTDWEFTYLDPGGAEHTAPATVTCLEP
jgi:hypothetical protein